MICKTVNLQFDISNLENDEAPMMNIINEIMSVLRRPGVHKIIANVTKDVGRMKDLDE